jgi:hypothetical protein
MTGYSGTPLSKKLGIREHSRAAFVNIPADGDKDLRKVVAAAHQVNVRPGQPLDFILLFVKTQADLQKQVSRYASKLAPAGMMWVAWPKKSSGIASDLSFNEVQKLGLANGLVDTKICAISEVWSGLKFVVRLKDRPAWTSAKPH